MRRRQRSKTKTRTTIEPPKGNADAMVYRRRLTSGLHCPIALGLRFGLSARSGLPGRNKMTDLIALWHADHARFSRRRKPSSSRSLAGRLDMFGCLGCFSNQINNLFAVLLIEVNSAAKFLDEVDGICSNSNGILLSLRRLFGYVKRDGNVRSRFDFNHRVSAPMSNEWGCWVGRRPQVFYNFAQLPQRRKCNSVFKILQFLQRAVKD